MAAKSSHIPKSIYFISYQQDRQTRFLWGTSLRDTVQRAIDQGLLREGEKFQYAHMDRRDPSAAILSNGSICDASLKNGQSRRPF